MTSRHREDNGTATPWQCTRVTKKLAPDQPGARKLARCHGPTLVCVRHRHNLEGTMRYTTVELVVEQVPMQQRHPLGQMVAVRLERGELAKRQSLNQIGARWDEDLAAWWLPRSTARRLRLLRRIVALDRV